VFDSKALAAKDQTIRILEEQIDRIAEAERIAEALVRIAQLEGELRLRDEQMKTLKAELSRITSMTPSTTPLYFTEEEEDLEYLKRAGLIDTTQYEELLAAAGFDNAEIEFAPEDYPRLSAAVPASS